MGGGLAVGDDGDAYTSDGRSGSLSASCTFTYWLAVLGDVGAFPSVILQLGARPLRPVRLVPC